MAKNIFPIIEVDAGRKIDFIVIRGTSLNPKSKSSAVTNFQSGQRALNTNYSQDNFSRQGDRRGNFSGYPNNESRTGRKGDLDNYRGGGSTVFDR